jgi:hypothetical protein
MIMNNIGGIGFGGTTFSINTTFSISAGTNVLPGNGFIDGANIQNAMLMGLLGGLVGGLVGGILGKLLGGLLGSALGGGMPISPFSLPNGVSNMGLVGGMNPMMPQIMNPMVPQTMNPMPPQIHQMNPLGINNQMIIMLLIMLLMMLLQQRGNNGAMNMMPFGNYGNINFNPPPTHNCGGCGNPSVPHSNMDEIMRKLEEIIKKLEQMKREQELKEAIEKFREFIEKNWKPPKPPKPPISLGDPKDWITKPPRDPFEDKDNPFICKDKDWPFRCGNDLLLQRDKGNKKETSTTTSSGSSSIRLPNVHPQNAPPSIGPRYPKETKYPK